MDLRVLAHEGLLLLQLLQAGDNQLGAAVLASGHCVNLLHFLKYAGKLRHAAEAPLVSGGTSVCVQICKF